MSAEDLPQFADPALSQKLIAIIREKSLKLGRVKLMEVCGTHTMEIGRLGLRSLLPKNVELVSGPGCPVCVTPGTYIDAAVSCAETNDCLIATYGDMVRVPGDTTSLEKARGQGVDVQVVASPLEALETARTAGRPVMFLAVGFETTAPATAVAIQAAARSKTKNISFLVSHKTIPPALSVLAQDPELAVSGFLLPGHVSAIIGETGYAFMGSMGKPAVITGFEPLDILAGIEQAIEMLVRGVGGVRNAYPRVVTPEGNVKARAAIDTVFEVCDDDWRGIGRLPQSGLRLRKTFAEFDAARKYKITVRPGAMPAGCACGEVLKGKIRPDQCPLFAQKCTPEHPVGPCMVSSEGSCAAYYKYEVRTSKFVVRD